MYSSIYWMGAIECVVIILVSPAVYSYTLELQHASANTWSRLKACLLCIVGRHERMLGSRARIFNRNIVTAKLSAWNWLLCVLLHTTFFCVFLNIILKGVRSILYELNPLHPLSLMCIQPRLDQGAWGLRFSMQTYFVDPVIWSNVATNPIRQNSSD